MLFRSETIEEILNIVPKLAPISFEILSVEEEEMYDQALMLADMAPNIFVKVPIINPNGSNNTKLIYKLMKEGIKVNVTCIGSSKQVQAIEDSKNVIMLPCGRALSA